MLLLFHTLCCYPYWLCHNRITSFCSTASECCVYIKPSQKAQECKWFTQESSYCVISGQNGAARISCVIGTTGKPVVNHQPCQRSKDSKAFEHFWHWTSTWKEGFCVTNTGKTTMRAVCASACAHMEMSGSTCVFFYVCVWPTHVFMCKGNGWQWKMWPILILIANEKKRTQYLWVLSRWTEEKGLSMKAYSLSLLKSALTWLQPFEVRLAVILERSAPASNNGNWMVEKELFNRAKGNASLSLSLFFLASCYILIDFFFLCGPTHFFFFFSTWKLLHVCMKKYAQSPN